MDMLPEWRVEPGLLSYPDAVAAMEARVAAIVAARAPELVWLIEHPPLYTAGTSALPTELLAPARLPVFASGRGGKYTYHGPGQRVVYVLLDLDRRGRDIRRFVAALEDWVVAALACHDIAGRVIGGKVGVWVDTPGGPAKIAAIGVRIRRWVSYHGLSINVAPALADFDGIVPCGLAEPVTSVAALGGTTQLAAIDSALAANLAAMLAAIDGTPAPIASAITLLS
jgi:lipoyl(octanoyl) transferase